MNILLDTHIYLWWLEDSTQLSKKARHFINEAKCTYISAASIWEIAIKIGTGKLQGDLNKIISSINKNNFIELPIRFSHISSLVELPDIHRDPFDRMLIAQAISEPLKLITADKTLAVYSDLIELI